MLVSSSAVVMVSADCVEFGSSFYLTGTEGEGYSKELYLIVKEYKHCIFTDWDVESRCTFV